MTNQNGYGYVATTVAAQYDSDAWKPTLITSRGEQLTIDFLMRALLDGWCYQVRSGTITTGLTADGTAITDTAAELCVDADATLTIVPMRFHSAVREVATTTITSVAVKAVGAASTVGAAFVPLPLLQGGTAARSTARVAQTGGVTVAAELATTTRRLWEFEHTFTQAPTTINGMVAQGMAMAAAADLNYVGKGIACIYVQVASTTAQVLHFSTLDYMEFLSASLT